VAIRDLLKAALRHRPDRIVLGEIRGGEAFRSLATPQHWTLGHAVHHPREFRATRTCALHELRFAKRCGPTVSRDQNKHRGFAQHRCPSGPPARTPIHLGGSHYQQLRPRRGTSSATALYSKPNRSKHESGHDFHTEIALSFGIRPRAFRVFDNVAVLRAKIVVLAKRCNGLAKAETIAGPEFQEWLAVHNTSGSDVFVGMNPIKDGAYSRTKDNLKEFATSTSTSTNMGISPSKRFEIRPQFQRQTLSSTPLRQASSRLESKWV